MANEHYTTKFYDERRSGAANSAAVIVPLVLELLPAKSVVDVGCGEGDWLAVFRRAGLEDVLGLDGAHVERGRLQIPQQYFQVADLSKPLRVDRAFDLAVCVEVAEHLSADCAPAFVESLVRLAPAVLFSAAIPFQGGVNHLNEQWPDVWASLFGQHSYMPIDFIRKRVWKNETVDWWYAQNTILFVHPCLLESSSVLRTERERTNPDQLSLVHPRKYLEVATPQPPPPEPSWGVKGASQLLMASVRNAIRKRLFEITRKDLKSSKDGSSSNSKT